MAIQHLNQPVVISGMAVLSSLGLTLREFTARLRDGVSGISQMDGHCAGTLSGIPGAEVKHFGFRKALADVSALPPSVRERASAGATRSSQVIQMATIAALQAWEEASLHEQCPDPSAIAIVVAGHNINQKHQFERSRDFFRENQYVSPAYALHFMDSDLLGVISSTLGIHGEGFTCGAASASGNAGIIQGCRLVQSGRADLCLVVAPLAALSPMEMQALHDLGAMGARKFRNVPAKACRPFDRDHEGFIYGEACACVVLESRASAAGRGARIWGEVLGSSIVLAGIRGPEPSKDAEVKAMQMALQEAAVAPSEVDYLNAHGSSSPIGDMTEVEAIKEVFKECLSDVCVNSTKGLTGHCLWSAGAVELVATLVQMNDGFIHANLNLDHPVDTDVHFAGAESRPAQIEIAMSNSFGFGGINTCLVVGKEVR